LVGPFIGNQPPPLLSPARRSLFSQLRTPFAYSAKFFQLRTAHGIKRPSPKCFPIPECAGSAIACGPRLHLFSRRQYPVSAPFFPSVRLSQSPISACAVGGLRAAFGGRSFRFLDRDHPPPPWAMVPRLSPKGLKKRLNGATDGYFYSPPRRWRTATPLAAGGNPGILNPRLRSLLIVYQPSIVEGERRPPLFFWPPPPDSLIPGPAPCRPPFYCFIHQSPINVPAGTELRAPRAKPGRRALAWLAATLASCPVLVIFGIVITARHLRRHLTSTACPAAQSACFLVALYGYAGRPGSSLRDTVEALPGDGAHEPGHDLPHPARRPSC